MTDLSERDIFWKWVLVFTVFSGLGSLFIILSVLLKLRKDFSARLVLYLSMADFGLSVICLGLCAFNLSNGHLQSTDQLACQVQPVITWYFMEVSILWLTVIAINSHKVVFTRKPLSERDEFAANIFCWGFPLLTSILPVISGTSEWYGPRNDLWCSFAQDQKGSQLLNILLYYIPCLVVIAFCYLRIAWALVGLSASKFEDPSASAKQMSMIRKMFLFVAAYFIVWTPLVISYIYEYASNQYISFSVEFVVDNLLHVQGILNFILYGLTTGLVHKIKEKLFRLAFATSTISKKTASKQPSDETIELGMTKSPS